KHADAKTPDTKHSEQSIHCGRERAASGPSWVDGLCYLTTNLALPILSAMKPFHLIATLCVMNTLAASASSLYEIPIKDIDGKNTSLKAYKGKVILIVNVASKCGLTPQYQSLEGLQEKYKDKGF